MWYASHLGNGADGSPRKALVEDRDSVFLTEFLGVPAPLCSYVYIKALSA